VVILAQEVVDSLPILLVRVAAFLEGIRVGIFPFGDEGKILVLLRKWILVSVFIFFPFFFVLIQKETKKIKAVLKSFCPFGLAQKNEKAKSQQSFHPHGLRLPRCCEHPTHRHENHCSIVNLLNPERLI